MFSPEKMPDPENGEYVIRLMIPDGYVIFKKSSFKAPVLPLKIIKDVNSFYQCLNDGEDFLRMIDERLNVQISGKYFVWVWWVVVNDL